MQKDFFPEGEAENIDSLPSSGQIPWSFTAEYKSGKVQQAFADTCLPEQVKAGFSFYDYEARERVPLGAFTAYIVDIIYTVGGKEKDGDEYINYGSNPVFDSRNSPFSVFRRGDKHPKFIGDLKYEGEKWTINGDPLPQGVGLNMNFVMMMDTTGEVFLLEASSRVQSALKKTIAAQTGGKRENIKLWSLCELRNYVYVVKFEGMLIKTDEKNNDYSGKGDMFFEPVLKVGRYTLKPTDERSVAFFSAIEAVHYDVSGFVENQLVKTKNRMNNGGIDAVSQQRQMSSAPPDAPLMPDSPPPPSITDDLPF